MNSCPFAFSASKKAVSKLQLYVLWLCLLQRAPSLLGGKTTYITFTHVVILHGSIWVMYEPHGTTALPSGPQMLRLVNAVVVLQL